MTVSELLSDPKRWTKGFFAKDVCNNQTDIHGERAAKFCLIGACCKVYELTVEDFYISQPYIRLVNSLRRIEPTISLTIYNDISTHAEVLALVKDANV